MAASSRLFQPYRALGLVADGEACSLARRGTQNFLTVSNGRAWQVYKCERLTLALISPQMPTPVRALASKDDLTFAACEDGAIYVWNRTTCVRTLRPPPSAPGGAEGRAALLLVLGDFLLAAEQGTGMLRIWSIRTGRLHSSIRVPGGDGGDGGGGQAPVFVALMHPATYVDKVLVALEGGALQLWNIRKQKLVHTFDGEKAGWGGAEIECLEQSPAVDVVAVGLDDGKVCLHNLRYDTPLQAVRHEEGAPTAVAFRTDSPDAGFMATGSDSGLIAIWDLGKRRLHSLLRGAHTARVTSLHFLHNEPVLVSVGADNALRMWIFDQPDGSGRLLRERQGHRRPPNLIGYYGSTTTASTAEGSDGTSLQLLSAGADRTLRMFHAVREQQSVEMSQKAELQRKRKRGPGGPAMRLGESIDADIDGEKGRRLPQVTAMASAETKERHWANVVTAHQDDPTVYTWRFDRRALAPHCLRQFDPSAPAPEGSAEAQLRVDTVPHSVAISMCGSFALVGTAGGAIFKYNLQSGQPRGAFPLAAAPTEKAGKFSNIFTGDMRKLGKKKKRDRHASDAHAGPVVGVGIDALNQTLLSASMDGKLKWWDFLTHKLLAEEDIGSPAARMALHRDAGLAAVVCDDLSVRVYDVAHRRLVRQFSGHVHRVNGVAFSPDGRWLFTASMDCSVRVWDVPSARCIDWMQFENPVLSLDMSPSAEFLTTVHAGSLGLFQWANRSFYSDVYLETAPRAPTLMDLPTAASTAAEEEVDAEAVAELERADAARDAAARAEGEGSEGAVVAEDRVDAPGAATLSTLPRAQWQTLFQLELIRARNKPTAPPKAPEKAPFFLPSTFGGNNVAPTFKDVGGAPGAEEDEEDPWDQPAPEGVWDDADDDDANTKAVATQEEGGGGGEGASAGSRLMSSSGAFQSNRGALATLLGHGSGSGGDTAAWAQAVADFLKGCGASKVDVEIRSLWLDDFDTAGEKNLSKVRLPAFRQQLAPAPHARDAV
jgi:U3 small nucleolar RNA-associated protein 21